MTDDSARSAWPRECQQINYLSTADKSPQPAQWYASTSKTPRPLLVGLHSWSVDHTMETCAPYAQWCIERDWVYIGPRFRGPNRTPEATGSPLVVGDIISAVTAAQQRTAIDMQRVYLLGGSGGGYTALQVVAQAPDLWTAVSSWVPITDLVDWYHESRARGHGYADDIVASCGGEPGASPAVDEQYRLRSPMTYLKPNPSVPIDINAGIHDGHTGSVPINHTLRAFNALAVPADHISEEHISHFVSQRQVPPALQGDYHDPLYGPNKVLFRRQSGPVRVTIFQGGHEILHQTALPWLDAQTKP